MINNLFRNKEYISVSIIFIFYGIIYCLISLVNHFLLRTTALDLGMFNHAIYNFAHFKANYFTLDVNGNEVNYFGDHFSPITIVYAPFTYLFGTNTLLIIQIASILFGGLGIYKYCKAYLNTTWTVYALILIHFFSIWGIYSALAYDFHNNVIGAMMVPWLIYYYKKGDRTYFLIFFFLILICKENMSFWLAFILAALVFEAIFLKKRKNIKAYLKFEIPLILLSLTYLGVVVSLVMPHLRQDQGLDQLDRYTLLGDSLGEIIKTIITKPKYIFTLMFESTLNEVRFIGEKSETHFMVLLSGGYLFIHRPHYLIMLIPVYFQKMLSNSHSFWGINGQYSIEFVPILSLALIDFAKNIKEKNNQRENFLLYICVLTTVVVTIATIDKRTSNYYDKVNSAFYQGRHYRSELNTKAIHAELKKIPTDAIVSCQTNLAPHLAFRNKIYHFPVVKDATHILVIKSMGYLYPFKTKEELEKEIRKYEEDPTFDVIYDKNELIIFRKVE